MQAVQSDAEIIRQLDDDWNESYRRRDRSPLAHILANDFDGTDGSGAFLGKAQLLIDPPGQVVSVAFSEQAVSVFGQTAVSRGRLTIDFGERRLDQRFTRVFAKRDEVWQAVSVAVTPIVDADRSS